ncbi:MULTISPECIES: hypothetical protein [Thermoanaerobacterium]|uniref:Uncharacterized protein n=2 Tax=Thermoanaerobacterium TaxID=28895 RepID=W9EC08_9THEO|nr:MULTISPECIES: hypothetical protein [Thermoanaerobacterium]AFK85217.1 hypothetical protein Tsac_0181 [Thermoanaerobacterium saccharolyticum JW/SL-YS485]ETO39607.1 hypothetical protein V518_0186 [Thermoanaerobacterium aotearoense SCUT27]
MEKQKGNIILKGKYKPEYKEKLLNLAKFFTDNGFVPTEHALNEILGKTASGRLPDDKQMLLDVLQNGENYIEPNGNIVRYKNGISIHIDKEHGWIITITPRKRIVKEWRRINE